MGVEAQANQPKRWTPYLLVRAAAHAWGQPLTLLQGGLEFALMRQLTPEKARTSLQQALEETQTVIALTGQLREYLEALQSAEKAQTIDLFPVVADVQATLDVLARDREFSLPELSPALDRQVWVHPARFRDGLVSALQFIIESAPAGTTARWEGSGNGELRLHTPLPAPSSVSCDALLQPFTAFRQSISGGALVALNLTLQGVGGGLDWIGAGESACLVFQFPAAR